MKPVLALLLAKIITLSVCAQIENTPKNKPTATGAGKLIGRIVDAKTNKGIEAASVQLFQKNSETLAGGMLTKPNGDFDISNLVITDTFRLEATAIGYAKQEIIITFDRSGKGSSAPIEKDLGNIKLNAESQYLNSVTVVGQ